MTPLDQALYYILYLDAIIGGVIMTFMENEVFLFVSPKRLPSQEWVLYLGLLELNVSTFFIEIFLGGVEGCVFIKLTASLILTFLHRSVGLLP